jgi:hypothetical protein
LRNFPNISAANWRSNTAYGSDEAIPSVFAVKPSFGYAVKIKAASFAGG